MAAQGQKTIWDAIEDAASTCFPEEIEPIRFVAKIQTQGAHGFSKPEGLIITDTQGQRWRVTAELLP